MRWSGPRRSWPSRRRGPEPSPPKGVRPLPAKEEAEEGEDEEGDGTVLGKLMASAKLNQGLVEVSLLPRSICEADLFSQALSYNAYLFVRLL